MEEKIINMVKTYISECTEDDDGDFHYAIIYATLSPFNLELIDSDTGFCINISRCKNLIDVNYKYRSEYRSEYNFTEIFMELEKINNIAICYNPPSMADDIDNDIKIYKRDKTIDEILK